MSRLASLPTCVQRAARVLANDKRTTLCRATPQIDSQSSSCASSNRVPVALAQATKTGLPLASKN